MKARYIILTGLPLRAIVFGLGGCAKKDVAIKIKLTRTILIFTGGYDKNTYVNENLRRLLINSLAWLIAEKAKVSGTQS